MENELLTHFRIKEVNGRGLATS